MQRVRTADPQNGNIPVQKRTKCEDTPKRALDGKRADGLHGKISTAVERKIERRQKDACMGSDRRGAGFYGRAFKAVSYTHLDVYKRQVKRSALHYCIFFSY